MPDHPEPVDHDPDLAPYGALTERQRLIFNWMVIFTLENFFQPTLREVMEAFSLGSPNSVMVHLRAIARKRLISLETKQSRAIRFHRRTPIPSDSFLRP